MLRAIALIAAAQADNLPLMPHKLPPGCAPQADRT